MTGADRSGGSVVGLGEAAGLAVAAVGGKAATLARLAAAGFPVPPGLVVTSTAWAQPAEQVADEITSALQTGELSGHDLFAVRSSAAAEDLAEASYAGQYETFLNVAGNQVVDAVARCHRAATAPRVAAYRSGRQGETGPGAVGTEMAVLVQPMVPAAAAGVAFTANPLTGDRGETLITAVAGLGETLVGGQASGDQWSIRDGTATSQRVLEDSISADQAIAVAELAGKVAQLLGGPQDIEWVLESADTGGRLMLLQARPMTALPEPLHWVAPGSGLWMRNFRLGEWLPEPMTPLFTDWLLPLIENGYLDGMRASVGAVVPFRHATVNGWYYNAVPTPTPTLLINALVQSRGHIVPVLYNALVRVSRDPAAADRAVLGRLHRQWLEDELPAYRRLVDTGHRQLPAAGDDAVVDLIDQVGRAAGRQLWFLAIVGGSAWKMEARLTDFADRHLPRLAHTGGVLADGVQVMLRGLPGIDVHPAAHAVFSADWYWPTHGETGASGTTEDANSAGGRRQQLVQQREAAEAACLAALAPAPRRQAEFRVLLEVTRRYATIREAQARDLTLGWPLLRACLKRLADRPVQAGHLDSAEQVFFLIRKELCYPTERLNSIANAAKGRRHEWQRLRRLPAPLTLGKSPRIIGDPLLRAVQTARGNRTIPPDAIVGEPASGGRATGLVRLISDPADFPTFQPGEILVTRSTAPAWTPLFAKAAAVVTDSGAITAHASIVAREYGIPAVVGTGDATHRLTTGQQITVDGSAGTVTLAGRDPALPPLPRQRQGDREPDHYPASLSRAAIHEELDQARDLFHQLITGADPTSLHRRSAETRWTNQQLLFHMLFGYLIVRRLRLLVLVFGRLPDQASRTFAQALNAVAAPFHRVNYLGSVTGGTVLGPARIAQQMDRTIDALHRRLDAETDSDLNQTMHVPPSWDPYFTETMTLRNVYHYGTQHFNHHVEQLTLDPQST